MADRGRCFARYREGRQYVGREVPDALEVGCITSDGRVATMSVRDGEICVDAGSGLSIQPLASNCFRVKVEPSAFDLKVLGATDQLVLEAEHRALREMVERVVMAATRAGRMREVDYMMHQYGQLYPEESTR